MRIMYGILSVLFPARRSGNRPVYDFSAIAPQKFHEFAKTLPQAPAKDMGRNKSRTALACLAYKNPIVRTMVWNMKTKKDRHAFACAGHIMADKLRDVAVGKNPIIIPMPIRQKRRRERGYNQCELLADEMRRHCLDEIKMEIRTDILFRARQRAGAKGLKNDKKQAFKNRAERIAGVRGAFSVNEYAIGKIKDVESRDIIVIDDVLTTGSTMNEAMSALRKAGYKNVSGLALAH